MDCNMCPYSQEIINGKIEINPQNASVGYCSKGFPQECVTNGHPRELDKE